MTSSIQNQQIPPSQWLEYFNQFTQANQGERYTLEICNLDLGTQELARHAYLHSITYDPPSKGDDIVIATGKDDVAFAHTIYHPTVVWVAQDQTAHPIALEILDAEQTKTILRLEPSAT